MASEAKIGLLLGLIIIFVIAFVLNELPRFGDTTDNGSERDGSPGIGGYEREHIVANETSEPIGQKVNPPSGGGPQESTITVAHLPVAPPDVPERPTDQTPTVETVKQTLSRAYYTVCEGDNLADIAKKFYGAVEGNRRVNVFRIFEANRQALASPHKIVVGQKLVIPPLEASTADGAKIGGIFSSSMFEKVESIGKRHLPAENDKPERSKQYVVREGDSLWRVASAQLGDGSRYREIYRLNAGILEDEDILRVGTRLKLPAQ